MACLLVIEVGISLLTKHDDRPWAGWDKRNPDPLPDITDVDKWLAVADLATASDETHILQNVRVEASDCVLFLHSDTPEGRFCSERLRHFYTNLVQHCEGTVFTDLWKWCFSTPAKRGIIVKDLYAADK